MDGFFQFYLVLFGKEWLEDVVPHTEEHGRVDDMERPVTKQHKAHTYSNTCEDELA